MKSKNIKELSDQQTSLSIFPIENKAVELSFTTERVSSDGGLLLLREVDRQLGLLPSITSCIEDKRDQRYITHSLEEMLRQRVYQVAAGYEDCNDCDDLREDSILKMCCERLPVTAGDLASQPTMSRLENSITPIALYRIGLKFIDAFINSYEKEPLVIVIDCDDTNNNTYGQQQELQLYNNYYGEYCYMPLHIYEGQSGKLITTILRPGRRHKQANIGKLLKKLVEYLRSYFPNTSITVRGDGHFASDDFMTWSETQKKVDFLTGLAGNSKLKEQTQVTISSATKEFEHTGKPVKWYHSFHYKAASWKDCRRIVAKVEVNENGTNIRYITSSMKNVRAKQLYEIGYCARGAAELRIKDHKLYLKSDRSSCKSFLANQFRLFLHSMAYVLIHTLQKEVLRGTQYANATMKTIQNKIIKTAAHIKELKTKIKVEFPISATTKQVQSNAYQLLQFI